ncbi:integrating conjugative element membrane protein (TIGR03745 family), partial [Plasticicumulans lactativorans]
MNTSPTSHRIPSRIAAPLLPLALAALPLSAFAQGLPTMEDPSRGQGSGILQTLQFYGYDIVLLFALLVVASMFVGVCYQGYSR